MKKSFEADTGRVLNIVINSLYSEKEIFLRELISNSSDAIDKLRFLSLTNTDLSNSKEEYKVGIFLDKKNSTITIKDNGVGMSEEELSNSLGTIARSGTSEFLEQIEKKDKDNKKESVNLIGQFGVGFYSSFMVAESVEVSTKKAGTDKAFVWKSDGLSGYEIDASKKEEVGTSIVLTIKKEAKEFLEEARLTHITKKYSDHIS